MITSQNEEILGIFDLVGKQKADGLERLFAAIHIVTKKEVVCFRWEPAVFKEAQEIVVLAMNVAADLHQKSALVAPLSQTNREQSVQYLNRSLQLK